MFFNVENLIEQTKKTLHNSIDIGTRIFEKDGQKVGLIFLRSMTNEELFSEAIYKPLENTDQKITAESLKSNILKTDKVEEIKKDDIVDKILRGNVVIVVDGEEKILTVDIESFPIRMPSEPPTSPVIRGPREGFTEDIKTNITLIRRRFYTKDLVLKDFVVGKYSKTKIIVTYLDGIADKNIVKKIENKLKKIKIDGVVDAFYIAKFLQDRPFSFFKSVGNSEKPDIVAAKMLEGRVAILVDGSPIALTLPFIALEEIQSSNDYYTNNYYATLIRYIRLIGFLLAIVASGTYLSLRLFHFNVIPTKFLITISDTTQSIPFTPFVELLFITLLFQILYEVSLRLPSYLGLATSIVGALILGDTGVNAGLISPPGVIVIALSKIAVYTMPEEAPQITVLQVLFLVLGGCLGLLGILGGLFYIVNYLNSIDSYGAPYLAPYSPRIDSDLKDAMIKQAIIKMKKRPQSYSVESLQRQK